MKLADAQSSMYKRRLSRNMRTPLASSITTTLNGASGFALGFAYGLQYDPSTPSLCYVSIESTILTIDEIATYLSNLINPAIWANLMLSYKDSIDFTAAVLSNC